VGGRRIRSGARVAIPAAMAAMATGAAAAAPAPVAPQVQINGGIAIHVPPGVTDPRAVADYAAEMIGERVAATMSASFHD
jgi:hypothetical protein